MAVPAVMAVMASFIPVTSATNDIDRLLLDPYRLGVIDLLRVIRGLLVIHRGGLVVINALFDDTITPVLGTDGRTCRSTQCAANDCTIPTADRSTDENASAAAEQRADNSVISHRGAGRKQAK